jgi:hypothetical protein
MPFERPPLLSLWFFFISMLSLMSTPTDRLLPSSISSITFAVLLAVEIPCAYALPPIFRHPTLERDRTEDLLGSSPSPPSLSDQAPRRAIRTEPYAPGWCGVHIHEIFGDDTLPTIGWDPPGVETAGNYTAEIFDAKGKSIGWWPRHNFTYDDSIAYLEKEQFRVDAMASHLPYKLLIQHRGREYPYFETNVGWDHYCRISRKSCIEGKVLTIRFEYAGDVWWANDTTRCSMGKPDVEKYFSVTYIQSIPYSWTRDIDCGFRC